MSEGKIFAGPRLRRLRNERGLTQARMAEDLGISTSYLNLVERNQRPVSAQLLLRLVDTYNIDVKVFTGSEEAHALSALHETFSDALFAGINIPRHELEELASASPQASVAILKLYHAYRDSVATASDFAHRLADPAVRLEQNGSSLPFEEALEVLRSHRNYFPELDDAAERFVDEIALGRDELYIGLKRYLESGPLGISVNIVPVEGVPTLLRFFDRHRRRILLSEMLTDSGRVFQLCVQIALLEHGALFDRMISDTDVRTPEGRNLLRVSFASYFAAAIIMPYPKFLSAAESTRYDLDILCRRFGASFEQVCHRLTTLQRPSSRGVPFFLIRMDHAGNVSKRFSAGSFQFARLGGACPRWNVHAAFQVPGKILTQTIQMPDGATFFSIARTVDGIGSSHPVPERQNAIALGCEIVHAPRLVYSDGLNLENTAAATPIGINCRLCERTDCSHRALPPLNRKLLVQDHRRDISPYVFESD